MKQLLIAGVFLSFLAGCTEPEPVAAPEPEPEDKIVPLSIKLPE
ncbi:hypothetical protein Z946_3552 [Sulfitobacter noctilucicola]|uniref:Lipoprotein n=1 Tax=Sulfitobacter noctilucicola TaxID=1342301 RepID=A0A7W6M844_9RHOB|nr:hypothetical protein [Sulfitobacter noctilucicola]KIN64660.1 hypothetical protein Z946_3552 [Sulfitobacter noctilucicola]MBB4174191.1 hypothetical protein [Sulfitobacter noctilucicola]